MVEQVRMEQKDGYIAHILAMYEAGQDNAYQAFKLSYGDSHEQDENETDIDYIRRCAEKDFEEGETDAALYQDAYDALVKRESRHEIGKRQLVVALTNDAYEYNTTFYTTEVSVMNGQECVDNDADISGLSINASDVDIVTYLTAALALAKERSGRGMNIRNVAGFAAQAGVKAVRDLAAAAVSQSRL